MPWLTLRPILHILLHLAVPAAIAWAFYRDRWQRAWLILLLGWLIDVDHLLAVPIYDPGRCSIGFHPLHTLPAILVYAGLLIPRSTRLLALGLCIHIVLDAIDCALL